MKFELRSTVLPLIALNAVVFILEFIFGSSFTKPLLLVSSDVYSRPWILFTHLFLHATPSHLLFNMWALLLFGTLLEQKIGGKRFIIFYILSGVIAGYISSFFYATSLGASGAIMGIIGVLVILMPDLPLLFFFVIPTPLWIAGIIYMAFDVFGVFFPSGVGSIAHLVGMGCGLLYGLHLKKERKKFTGKFSSKKHLESGDVDEYLRSGRI